VNEELAPISISLGIGGGFDGHVNPSLLRKFSMHVGATYYVDWPEWRMVEMSDDVGFMGDTILNTGLTQSVRNVGANGIRPYDTIEVIRFLCVSPKIK
jgi:hypothetical protein